MSARSPTRRRVGDRYRSAVPSTRDAAALAAIDVVYVARRRIRAVYLLDAALEAGLVVMLTRSR